MDEDEHSADTDSTQTESITVPTAREVLKRSLWAAVVLVAGFPLFAWWFMDDNSSGLDVLVVFVGCVLLALGVQRITQAPRPRLDKGADREPVKRALAIALKSGSLPEDPMRRSAAGMLACQHIEGMLLSAAMVLGIILASFVKPTFSWVTPVAVLVTLAAINSVWVWRSWRYLKTLHVGFRTT